MSRNLRLCRRRPAPSQPARSPSDRRSGRRSRRPARIPAPRQSARPVAPASGQPSQGHSAWRALIRPVRAAAGGTLRIGQQVPAAAVEPVSVADAGGLVLLQQVGEFLTWDGPDLVLRPQLAESWSPNQDGTVWTFKLRQGVKFHDGRPMTAADVVATFDRLSDPANSSNALSVFRGLLSPGGTRKVDDYTVEFQLEVANGGFPYMVSSDNYNAIVLPADYAGDFEKTFNGTGPFKLEKFTPKVGASFVRNDDYWGPKALLDRTEFVFFTDIQPQILALQGGQIDVINQLPVLAGRRPAERPQHRHHRPQVGGAPAGAHALRHGPVPGCPGAARHRLVPRSAADRAGLDEGQGFPRQRQPVRRRLSDHRPERAAAREGPRPGQAAGRSRRPEARDQGHADHRALSRDPRVRGPDPERGQGDRRSRSSSTSWTRAPITARPCSASRTGSIR